MGTNKPYQFIQNQLDFTTDILEKYDIDEHEERKIRSSVNFIKNKLYSSVLYLGIVGEFSSGKSTLINALIQQDLLNTDIIQATTSTPTLLSYNDNLSLSATFSNGSQIYPEINNNNFDHKLSKLVTEEKLTKHLCLTSIGYPSKFLDNNIAIIDTPGINSTNERHTKVSEWILKNFCDLPLIIIPADQPISDTIRKYLSNSLNDVFDRCIFVVTKIDLILNRANRSKNLKELDRYKKTIKGRIEKLLDISNPKIHYLSPQIYLDEYLHKTDNNDKEIETFINKFDEFRKDVIDIIGENRYKNILKQSYQMLENLNKQIIQQLKDRKKKYQKDHQSLLNNKIPDLKEFITKKKVDYQKALINKIVKIRVEISKKVNNEIRKIKNEVKIRIYGVDDRRSLKIYIKNELANHINICLSDLEKLIISDLKNFENVTNNVLSEFEQEFQKIYMNLATLGNKISAKKNLKFDKSINNSLAKLNSDTEDIAIKGGYTNKTGAMVVGGTIGTFIAPGLGTLIGAKIGEGINKFIKSIFLNLDSIKDDTWKQVSSKLDPKLDNVKKNIHEQMDKLENILKESLASNIDKYFVEYEQLVQKKISEDEKKRIDLENHTKTAEKDIKLIESKSKKLKDKQNKKYDIDFSFNSVRHDDKADQSLDSLLNYIQYNNFTEPLKDNYLEYFELLDKAEKFYENSKYKKALNTLSKVEKIDIDDMRYNRIFERSKSKYKKRLKYIVGSIAFAILILLVIGYIYIY